MMRCLQTNTKLKTADKNEKYTTGKKCKTGKSPDTLE